MLGGVEIPQARGLRGHSDADVLLHALADALLGAAGLEDIGAHFPDTEGMWKDAESSLFIRNIMRMLKKKSFTVENVDLTVIAQVPKIGSHREAIKKSIAALLGIAPASVNVKATTTDYMGFIGRAEGMAAQAVVLLKKGKTSRS